MCLDSLSSVLNQHTHLCLDGIRSHLLPSCIYVCFLRPVSAGLPRKEAPTLSSRNGRGKALGGGVGRVTSLKSKEESLQRAQMVASSTSPSYCPARTGLSFFKLAARWGGRQERNEGKQSMRCREQREADRHREGETEDWMGDIKAGKGGREEGRGKEQEIVQGETWGHAHRTKETPG